MAEWKKVIVSGSDAELNNIFASGAITGSHISSSGNLFASLSVVPHDWVVTYNSESGQFYYTSSDAVGTDTIGTPSDTTYDGGLFPFTSGTLIADAVDDINEVLAGLAPPAAPALDYIDATAWTTVDWESGNYYLAFGNSLSTSSYSNLNLSSTTGFSDVDFGNIYTGSVGSTNNLTTSRIRLGVLASNANPIIITLNNDVAANSGTYVNYPADSFKANSDPAAGETYTIDINGTTYTYTATTSASVTNGATSPVGPTITLTAAQTGSFIGTGQSFSLFRHRTGTVSIPASTWRTGSNYARVSSSIAGGPTTYIDWVFDPAAASGNFPYTFSTPTSTSFSATGEKALSGVKYYTGISYNFSCSLSNYYKNSYRLTQLAANSSTHGFGSFSSPAPTATAITPPSPTTADSIFQISSAHTLSSAVRLLEASLASRVNVSNGLGTPKTGNSNILTTPTILYDNVNTTNTTLIENFCLENYRVPSASYNTQAAASTAINTFPSTSALATSDLAVYNGAARYPTQLLNGGNINGSTIVYKIAGQPDYSGATGNRSFYRVFQNGASQRATWNIRLDGSNATFVTVGTSLTGNNMTLEIKVPDETGWRDVLAPAPNPGTYTALNDGVGCKAGAAIALNGTGGDISLVSERLRPNAYFVLRFTVGSLWAGNINKITISGL